MTTSPQPRSLRVGQTFEDFSEEIQNPAVTTTAYLFDANNPTGYAQVLEETVDGSLAKTYTLGHDVIAQAAVAAGQVLQLLYDAHGSTRAVVDQVGAILQRFAYKQYGRYSISAQQEVFKRDVQASTRFGNLIMRRLKPSLGGFIFATGLILLVAAILALGYAPSSKTTSGLAAIFVLAACTWIFGGLILVVRKNRTR